jgi:hypothetical protein
MIARYGKYLLLSLLGYTSVFAENAVCNTGSSYEIIVYSGAVDRKNTIVSFYVPTDFIPGSYRMVSDSNDPVYLQVDERNIGTFIIAELPRGEIKRYLLTTDQQIKNDDVKVVHMIDDLKVTYRINDNDIISYYHNESPLPEGIDTLYTRAGYIHPVRSPSGVILTQDFAEVHPHHYGIWSSWTNVEFNGRRPDFWNVGKETGYVEFESLDETWEGYVHAGLRSRHKYIDFTLGRQITALNEQWEVRVFNISGKYHIFDITVIQTANSSMPVVLPEHEYGGVGFRGHEDWEGRENAFFLTSEGKTRTDAHGTRARWCHIGGYTGSQLAGIAILDHPGNFRHPQPVHVHQTRAFFNYAVIKYGEMVIEPGIPYRMKYRFITYDGEPDPAELDRLWMDFAYPPSITIIKKDQE